MTTAKVVIQTIEDRTKGRGFVIPDGTKPEDMIEGPVTFGICEQGMQTGKPSVTIVIELPDGKFAYAPISGGIFETMHGAYTGACARFDDLKKHRRKN